VRRNHRLPIAAASEPANFYPFGITGLVAWYDFSDAIMLYTDTARSTPVSADGNSILGVRDKSPAGAHLSEATNGPTYKVGILNGQSVARFDGTNDTLKSAAAAFSLGPGITAFLVATQTTAPGSRYVIGGDGDHMLITNGANNQIVWGGSQNVGYSLIQSANFLATTTGIIVGTYNTALASGSEVTAWRNGTVFPTVTSSAENTGNVLMTQFAAGATVAGGSFWNGDIAETLIYNAVLTNSQINTVANYLVAKYALSWTAI